MTDVEKKVDMSLDELVAMRQKEAKKKARRPRPMLSSTLPLARLPSYAIDAIPPLSPPSYAIDAIPPLTRLRPRVMR